MRLIDIAPYEISGHACMMYTTEEGSLVQTFTSDIPTIDAVPVVRCKDCKYWQDNNGGYPHEECRWGKDETPDADDFCSYGERKGGEG